MLVKPPTLHGVNNNECRKAPTSSRYREECKNCATRRVFQQSAAHGLTDLCADAVGALKSPQGLDDIETMRLRKETQEFKKEVHDEYPLTLFNTFDALLKKRD